MYGGSINQPMDFRGYGQGQFGSFVHPVYPNPLTPYGAPYGPSSYLSAAAGYMPLAGMPSYGNSLRYASAAGRSASLQRELLSNDPRAGLARRALGIGDGVLSGIATGAINRPGINHLFGGDIRDVGSASMLAASGGVFTKHGQSFSGGMLQQAYATEISRIVTGSMNGRGEINGLNVSRTAETIAAMSAVPGNAFAGRMLRRQGNTIGLDSRDKEALSGVIDASTSLVSQLEEIFGNDKAVPELLKIAQRVTGKVVRTQRDAEGIERQIRSIRVAASAAGVDERAMFDTISQGNRFATNVSAPVNLAMNAVTTPFAIANAKAAGVSPDAVLNVQQQSAANVMRSAANRRAMIGFALADRLRANGNVAGAELVEATAAGMNMSNMAERTKIIEDATGRNFSDIEQNDPIAQRLMQVGQQTRAGGAFLLRKTAAETSRQQAPIIAAFANSILQPGKTGKRKEAAALVKAIQLAGVKDVGTIATFMSKGLSDEAIGELDSVKSIFAELSDDERRQVFEGARAFSGGTGGVGEIAMIVDDAETALGEVFGTSVNSARRAASSVAQAKFYSAQAQLFGGKKDGNLFALDLMEGLAGGGPMGTGKALGLALKGTNTIARLPGTDPRAWSDKQRSLVLKRARGSVISMNDPDKFAKFDAIMNSAGNPEDQLNKLISAGFIEAFEVENAGREGTSTMFADAGTAALANEISKNADFSGEVNINDLKVLGRGAGLFGWGHAKYKDDLFEDVDPSLFGKDMRLKNPADTMGFLLDGTSEGGKRSRIEDMLAYGRDDFGNRVKDLSDVGLGYLQTVLDMKPDLSENQKKIKEALDREQAARDIGKETKSTTTGDTTHLGVVSFTDDHGNKVVLTPVSD